MATLITHPMIPLALGAAAGREKIPARAVAAGVLLSVVPDLDVVSFRLGIPYRHILGHRGISHSLLFALATAILFAVLSRVEKSRRGPVFLYLFLSCASHGVLDAVTNGGMGIAFFAPFSGQRYFLPWQVLQVSPIGAAAIVSRWGLAALRSELLWIWAPALAAGSLFATARRLRWSRR